MQRTFKKNLISIREASKISGYNTGYISSLARIGKIASKREGHTWSVDRESLRAYLQLEADRKIVRARALARARELEYRAHRTPAARKPLTPHSFAPRSLMSEVGALATALLVITGSVYAANSGLITDTAAKLAAVTTTVAANLPQTFAFSQPTQPTTPTTVHTTSAVIPLATLVDSLTAPIAYTPPVFAPKQTTHFSIPTNLSLGSLIIDTAHALIQADVSFAYLPTTLAPKLAEAVFTAEYHAALAFTSFTNSLSSHSLSLVLNTLRSGRDTAALALAPLTHLPNLSNSLAALSLTEKAALATYTTIHDLFFHSSKTIVTAPATTSTSSPQAESTIVVTPLPLPSRTASSTRPVYTPPTSTLLTTNSYPTYTTVIQGVTNETLTNSLASLKSSILSQVSGMLAPVATQTATTMVTVRDLARIDELTNLVVKNGSFQGGTFTTLTGTSLTAGTITATESTATSTFANGIKLTGGCYQLSDGTCAGTGAWGSISGTLSNQTDLQSALDSKLSLTNWYATTSAPQLTTLAGVTSLGTYSGLIAANSGSLYQVASSSLFGFTPVSNAITLTANYPIIGGGDLTANHSFSLAFGTTTSNTWGGTQTFTNAPTLSTFSGLIAGNSGATYAISTTSLNANITGNAGTVTNGVYTTTFNGLFDTRLSATTTLPQLTTLAGVTTLGTYTGLIAANSGSLYQVASTSLFGFTPQTNQLAKGNFLVGNDAGTAQATSSIFISSTGNVGMGTTTPINKLHLFATSAQGANVNIDNTVTNSWDGVIFSKTGVQKWFIGNDGSNSNMDFILRRDSTTNDLLVQHSTGNLGVGTTSPAATLSIQGTSYHSGIAFFGGAITATSTLSIAGAITSTATAANTFPFASTTAISSTGSAYFATSGGSVGIGLTNPQTKLVVNGSTFVGDTSAYELPGVLTIGSTQDVGISLIRESVVKANFVIPNSGGSGRRMTLVDADNASLNVMTWKLDGSGSVGIGLTSPAYKLDVSGNGHFTSLVDADHFVATSTTATSTFAGFIDVNGTGTNATSTFASNLWVKGTLRTGTGSMYLNDTGLASSDGNINLNRSGVSWLNGGNVGIGSTSPQAKFAVVGDSYFHGGIASGIAPLAIPGTIQLNRVGGDSAIVMYEDGTAIGQIRGDSAIGNINITNNSLTPILSVNTTSGNVGIGTTTPGSLFELYASAGGSISPVLRLSNGGGGAGTGSSLDFIQTAQNAQPIGARISTLAATGGYSPDIVFSTKADTAGGALTEKVRIMYNGNVGIGTTTPSFKLDVYNSGGAIAGMFQGSTPGAVGIGSYLSTPAIQGYTNDSGTGSANLALNPVGGNVGIGTTNPGTLLEVSNTGSGGKQLKVANIGAGYDAAFLLTNSTNGHFQIYSGNSSGTHGGGNGGNTLIDFRQAKDLIIGASTDESLTSRANYLTIRGDNGNVGIGTTAPGNKLDVQSADNTAATNIGSFYAANRTQAVGLGYQDVRQQAAGIQLNVNAGTTGVLYLGNTSTGGVNIAAGGGGVAMTGAVTGGTYNGQTISSAANFTGTIAAAGTLTLTGAAPQIALNNGTSNWIAFNGSGVAAPTFTTSSAGTKIILYPNVTASTVDFALGIESGTLWSSVPTTGNVFKWYGATTQAMSLTGAGALTLGSGSGTLTSGLINGQTISSAANFTGTMAVVGALNVNGATNPGNFGVLGGGTQVTTLATARSLAVTSIQTLNSSGWLLTTFMAGSNPSMQVVDQAGTSAGNLDLMPYGGNVGIGTTAPANTLQIGSVGSTGYAGNQLAIGNGTQVMAFYTNTTAATWYTNTNFALMPAGGGSIGNVGIGTTAPSAKLSVSIPATNTISTADSSNTSGITVFGTGNLVRLQMGVGASTMGPYGGWIQSSFDNGGGSNGVEPLLLNPSGGNVGVGTTGPNAALEVSKYTGTLDTALRLKGGNSASYYWLDVQSDFYNSVSGNMRWNFNTNDFASGSKTPLTIMGNGNIGVGTTTALEKLDIGTTVNDSTTGSANLRFSYNPQPNNYYNSITNIFSGAAATHSMNFNTVQNTTAKTPLSLLGNGNVIMNAGNVGIGTTNPLTKFHVHVGTDQNFWINPAVSMTGSVSVATANDAGNANTPMEFRASAFSMLGGNVGINTTNPGAKLEVVGDVLIPSNNLGLSTITNTTGAVTKFLSFSGGNSFADVGLFSETAAGAVNQTAGLNLMVHGWGYTNDQNFNFSRWMDGGRLLENIQASARIAVGGTSSYFNVNGGNVGVGTTTPTGKLEVHGGILKVTADVAGTSELTSHIVLRASSNNLKTMSVGLDTTNNFGWLQANIYGGANLPIVLQPNGGNVGIGTTNPQAKLDTGNNWITPAYNVTADTNVGITWYTPTPTSYGIYRTSGAWTASTYQQLKMQWDTGIILAPGAGAYDKSMVGVIGGMSIGTSYYATKPPASSLIVEGNVGIGLTNPDNTIQVASLIDFKNSIYGTFLGYLTGAPSGLGETLVGYTAGRNVSSGGYNTYLGYQTGYSMDTGVGNTAVGAFTYQGSATGNSGSYNTVVGYTALSGVTTGGYNTSLGYNSGYTISTGTYNIAIGPSVTVPTGTASYQMNIGNVLYGDLANTRIGIGITNPTYTLQVNGQPAANGYTAFTNYSDARLKDNVTEITNGSSSLELINRLRPVTFSYNSLTGYSTSTQSRRVSGFIAQELQTVFPEMVGTTTINGTEYLDTNLSDLPLYLVKAVQQLSSRTSFISNAASTTILTADATGNIGIGTNTPNAKLTVSGNIFAMSYEVTNLPATSFTLGSTTVTANIPLTVLTASTTVDLYKLATYALSGVQALADKLNAQEVRMTSLETRVAALESGAVGSASGTPTFSSTALASALNEFGVMISHGFAQFGSLIADRFVAATNSTGTSSAGTVSILAGNTVAQVTNEYVTPTTKIFITFNSSVTGNWYVSEKQNGSFRVILSESQASDVSFDYLLVQTEGQIATTTPESATTPASPAPSTPSVVAPAAPDAATSTPATTSSPTSSSVTDTTPPVVTLMGAAAMQITVGDTFTDPGATAADPSTDGLGQATDLTAHIIVSGTVDTATAGLYTLTYTATDAAGNSGSVSRVVTVVAPVATVAPAETSVPPAVTPAL